MAWYWIILIILGYIIMWAVTSIILSRIFHDNSGASECFGVLWPIALPVIPLVLLRILIGKLVEKFGYKG